MAKNKTVRETVTDAVDGKKADAVQMWTGRIAAYEREFSAWESRVDRILKRYRDENRAKGQDNSGAKFNILWSNVQTLVPAVYSKVPKPDVSRRFRDSDPVGRVAALLLERALEFELEHYPDFRGAMKSVVLDRFLGGRGTTWVRYEPHVRAVAQKQPTDGESVSTAIDEPHEELDYECAPTDYVPWRDFGHAVARTWDEVPQVWRRVYLTREACIERFGEEKGKTIPLDCIPDELKEKQNQAGGDGSDLSRACIYECWDKLTLKATWISKSMPQVLDEVDDPLELEGFFPCPPPLYATMTNESLIPVPDFSLYQDQAKELDTLADRIQGLIDMLQVKGVHDASIKALSRIFTEGQNGSLIPVENWAAFVEKNGLRGSLDIVDLKPIYEALRAAYDAMQQVLSQVYDLTGISDIIRGQSNANETATAQRIKGQYASLRLKSMQTDVAVFASRILQLKAQVICGNYAPETILKMACATELMPEDQAFIPQAMELLIGPERFADPVSGGRGRNPVRDFRIEVNSDTMVMIDEDEEKTRRMEFITAQGAFMEKAMPMAEAAPQLRPLILQLWKFGVTAFKVGKTLEGVFDQAIAQMEQAAKNPPQPQPNPEMERVKADMAVNQQRLQIQQQVDSSKQNFDAEKFQREMSAKEMDRKIEAELEANRIATEDARENRKMEMEYEFKRWDAELTARTQLEIAQISAQTTLQTEQA